MITSKFLHNAIPMAFKIILVTSVSCCWALPLLFAPANKMKKTITNHCVKELIINWLVSYETVLLIYHFAFVIAIVAHCANFCMTENVHAHFCMTKNSSIVQHHVHWHRFCCTISTLYRAMYIERLTGPCCALVAGTPMIRWQKTEYIILIKLLV